MNDDTRLDLSDYPESEDTMELQILLDLSNDAFLGDYNPAVECARILRECADLLIRDGVSTPIDRLPLHDINGNRVGIMAIE